MPRSHTQTLLLSATRRIRHGLFHSDTFRLYHIATGNIPPYRRSAYDSCIEYRELAPASWPLIEQALIASGESNTERVRNRLHAGDRVFGGLADNRILHFTHVTAKPRRLGDSCLLFELGPRERFIYKCHTLRPARGRGIYEKMLRKVVETLRHEGITDVYIDVNVRNIPSARGIEAAGFSPLREFTTSRILGVRLPLRTKRLLVRTLCGSTGG